MFIHRPKMDFFNSLLSRACFGNRIVPGDLFAVIEGQGVNLLAEPTAAGADPSFMI